MNAMATNDKRDPLTPDLSLKSIDYRKGYIDALQFVAGMIEGDIAIREGGGQLQREDRAGVSALVLVGEAIDEMLREMTGHDPQTGKPIQGEPIQ